MKFTNYLRKSYYRNLVEDLLKKKKSLIKGNILEIGSRNRRYDHFFNGKIVATDLIPDPKLNVIKADLTNLQFQANSFNSVFCIEVFHYLELDNFIQGFEEIHRVLKKKGKAIITFPFYSQDHKDNIRVTYKYLLYCLNKINKFDFNIIKIGNRYTAFYDIIRFSRAPRLRPKYKNLGTKIVLIFIYLIIKLFSLENIRDSFYTGFFIICSKK